MFSRWSGDADDPTPPSGFRASPLAREASRIAPAPSPSPRARSSRSLLAAARAASYGTGAGAGAGAAALAGGGLRAGGDGGGFFKALADEARADDTAALLALGPHADIARGEIARARRAALPCFCFCGRVSVRAALAIGAAAFVVFAAVMAVVGFQVIAPAYVKSRIAATTLVFSALNISAPTGTVDAARGGGGAPGGGALGDALGFTITVAAALSGLSPVSGTLESFPATLSFGGAAVAAFTMPAVAARAGVTNALAISAPVAVLDAAAFTAFGVALLGARAIDVTLTGVVAVTTTVGGVSLTIRGVDFQKTVSLAGADGLRGARVTSFSLLQSTRAAAVAEITVAVQNPSAAAISPLGDFAAGVVYGGAPLGRLYARGASLARGESALAVSGDLSPAATPAAAAALGALISRYLGGLPTNLTAVAASCGPPECPGAVPLWAPLLDSGAVTLNAVLPPSAQPLVAGVEVRSMFLEPRGAAAVGLMLNVTVFVAALLGVDSPIDLYSLALNCTLRGDGVPLGDVHVPRIDLGGREAAVVPVGGGPAAPAALGVVAAPRLLAVNLSLAVGLSIVATADRFADFVVDFLSNAAVNVTLGGGDPGAPAPRVAIELGSVLGNLSVAVPLDVTTRVRGIGGFPGVRIVAFTVLNASAAAAAGAAADAVAVLLTVALENASPASFPLGANATLGVFSGGQRLGQAVVFNQTLVPGENLITTVGVIAPVGDAALAAVSGLFSQYLAGAPSALEVRGESVEVGGAGATPDWLRRAVSAVRLQAELPGLPPALAASLLRNATVEALTLDLWDEAAGAFFAAPRAAGAVSAVLCLPFSLPVGAFGPVNVSLALVEDGSGERIAAADAAFAPAQFVACETTDACAAIQAAGGGAPTARAARAAQARLDALGLTARAAAAGGDGTLCTEAGETPLYPAGVLFLTLPPSSLAVESPPAFARLVKAALSQKEVRVGLKGTASPNAVGLPFGTIPLRGVLLDTVVALVGMANLTSPPAVILSGDILRSSNTTLQSVVTLNITNPSTLTGSFGPAQFGVFYRKDAGFAYDTPHARAFVTTYLANLKVGPGQNAYVSPGTFVMPDAAASPVARRLAEELLGRFLSQLDSNCTLEGFDSGRDGGPTNSSASPLLQPAFGGLVAKAAFPGVPAPLVTHAIIYTDTSDLAVAAAEPTALATMRLTNALSVNITLREAALTMFLCAKPGKTKAGFVFCGDAYQSRLGFFYNGSLARDFRGGLVAPARSFADFNLSLTNQADEGTLELVGVEAIFDRVVLGKGNGTVSVLLTDLVGGAPFAATLNISQSAIPICVGGVVANQLGLQCDFSAAAPATPNG